MRRRRKLLLICPDFFGYDRRIKLAAEAIGYDVIQMDARASTSAGYKSALKLAPALTRAVTQSRYRARLEALADPASIDHILVIRGDGLNLDTYRSLRTLTPQATMTFYLWDSLHNVPGASSFIALADHVFTFDPEDSNRYGWAHLPLFSRKAPPGPAPEPPCPARWDWSFIGSLHSDRHRVLRRIVADNTAHSWFVHCYVQNFPVRLFRALSDPKVLGSGPPALSNRILSYDRCIELMRQSRAVVDIEHPRQTGLTMRTIETLVGGKKLITTNPHVRNSDLYHPARVAVIDRWQPKIPTGFFEEAFPRIEEALAKRYSVEGWLRSILAEPSQGVGGR